jgi:hypothetical protein
LTEIRLFISHASHDRELVRRIVELLRAALNLPAAAIRCTSVEEYRLPAGTNISEQLRIEVHEANAFIGVVSERSVRSLYVLFEMGARWGAAKHVIPLLAPGTPASALGGPLATLSALDAQSPADLHQLVEDVASVLSLPVDSRSTFERHIALVTQTPASRAIHEPKGAGASDSIGPTEVSLYMRNKQTGKFIDVTNWEHEEGVGIQQFDWHGGDNQTWILAPVGGEYVTIRSKHSEKYLTVPDSSMLDDVQVIQSNYTGGRNQQWKPYRYEDGSFAFSARHSGKFLHVQDGSAQNNTPIVQKHWPQADSQRWLLQLAALL